MSGAKFSILGLKEIKGKMQQLPEELVTKAVRPSLKKAAKLVRDAAYAGALAIDDPATQRRIADNLSLQFASRVFRRTQGDITMYRIGVSTERGRIPSPNDDTGTRGSTPHWHLVELGTEHSRSKPFMRPALDNNVNQVIDTFVNEFNSQLDKLTK